MAASMRRGNGMNVLLRNVQQVACQTNLFQCRRTPNQITYTTTAAVPCMLSQQRRLVDKRAVVNVALPYRTMCKYRPPKELYKTLYEATHPFYKIIKYKRKKFVAAHPLPVIKEADLNDSPVLLYDDEDILRSMGKAYLADQPVDDIYVMKHYPPQIATVTQAIEKLRAQDKWDFCPDPNHNREVNVTLLLDGKLEREKKVGSFEGFLAFPHQFTKNSRVLCFARDAEAERAKEAGAYIVTGPERIRDLLSEKIRVTKQVGVYLEIRETEAEESDVQPAEASGTDESNEDVEYVDYVVATTSEMRHLIPLKKLLRSKYPTTKKGSVNKNIDQAVHLFTKGTPYKCSYTKDEEEERFLSVTAIGKLEMTNEQLEDNLKALIDDVCKHKLLQYGAFIKEISITAPHLDTYTIESAHYLPQPEVEEDVDIVQELELLEKEMAQKCLTQS